MKTQSRAKYAQDRSGNLMLFVRDDLWTSDQYGDISGYTETGAKIAEICAETLQEFNMQWFGWEPYHKGYVCHFERDADFFRGRHASFGWISSFAPVVDVSRLNRALTKAGIRASFVWYERL